MKDEGNRCQTRRRGVCEVQGYVWRRGVGVALGVGVAQGVGVALGVSVAQA